MKYFDEAKMADIQEAFDSEVLKWKNVVSRPMMGCLCYFRKRKFVCFLVTDGIVITKLSDKDQAMLREKFGGKPFEMAGQTGRMWVTPVKSAKDVSWSCHSSRRATRKRCRARRPIVCKGGVEPI